MTRREMAAEAARWLNEADPRLAARVVARGGEVKVVATFGRRQGEISFPSQSRPEVAEYGYSLWLGVRSVRERIEAMPASDD
jgi:hypothetical protein